MYRRRMDRSIDRPGRFGNWEARRSVERSQHQLARLHSEDTSRDCTVRADNPRLQNISYSRHNRSVHLPGPYCAIHTGIMYKTASATVGLAGARGLHRLLGVLRGCGLAWHCAGSNSLARHVPLTLSLCLSPLVQASQLVAPAFPLLNVTRCWVHEEDFHRPVQSGDPVQRSSPSPYAQSDIVDVPCVH